MCTARVVTTTELAPDPVPWLRLRQICLVAHDLEGETAKFEAVFGWRVCHRDPNVARYGLANVLFAIGNSFLEIVSPLRPGTAAGRFLERHQGRDGYMVILDCDDPDARARHASSLGVRIANRIEHHDYLGVQLHPADTGAAMLEFNRSTGGAALWGAYAPAGPEWRGREDDPAGIVAARLESDAPAQLAARWAGVLGREVQVAGELRRIALDTGALEFAPSAPGAMPALRALTVAMPGADAVLARAHVQGCLTAEGAIELCGVRLDLRGC
jgi:hypothetical protein